MIIYKIILITCLFTVASLCQSISISWASSIGTASGFQYGSNDFPQSVVSGTAAQTTYASRMSDFKLPLVRIHDQNLPTRWTTNGAWDSTKIAKTYDVYDLMNPRPTIMQTIPHPLTNYDPSTNVISDPNGYATLCANLVRVINIQMGKNVIYWEPMNELDDHYYWNNIDQLYSILSTVAAAMKAVDSRIKIVAPAISTLFSFNSNTFQSFKIQRLLADFPQVDVISWHRYAQSQSWTSSNDALMQITPLYKTFCKQINDLVVSTLGRRIPIFLGEYNLAASSSQHDKRTQEVFGVAFFASMHKNLVEGGCDWATSWNIWDTYYGLMNGSNFLVSPPAQIFTLSNTYMKGTVFDTLSNDIMVEAFAVQSSTSKNVYIINKSNTVKSVTITSSGTFGSNGLTRITAGGGTTPLTDSLPAASPVTINIQPYNVVLLIDKQTSSYVGCLADSSPSSFLNGASQSDTQNTPSRCSAFCRSKSSSYLYSGVSYSWCFCGNSYPATNIGADSGCTQPCNGDSSIKCGGPNYHTSLYKL